MAVRALSILFVDDDADFTEAVAYVLRGDGHHVRCARDGTSAVAFASELSPDAVLLDLRLPDANGYVVARALRRRLPRTTPIIVLTALPEANQCDDVDLVVSKLFALELFGGLVDYVSRFRRRNVTGGPR